MLTSVLVVFEKQNADGEVIQDRAYFMTKLSPLTVDDSIFQLLLDTKTRYISLISDHEMRGSGFVYREIVNLDLFIVDYKPVQFGHTSNIPPWFNGLYKKHISSVNLAENEYRCMIFSILAALYPFKNVSKNRNYQPWEHARFHIDEYEYYTKMMRRLNLKNIKYPSTKRDLLKIENQNQFLSLI